MFVCLCHPSPSFLSLFCSWYFGAIKGVEAERFLCANTIRGTFLIRESESKPGDYLLGIQNGKTVKHYRIRKLDEGGLFITRRVVFSTLKELVEYYMKDSDGLCCPLRMACKRQVDISHMLKDVWEIPQESIKLLRLLDNGRFSKVYEGVWDNKVPVAVKTLKSGTMQPQTFLEEADIMKKLRHPKIIQLYALCTKEEPLYIITELMPKGNLVKYLQSQEGQCFQLPQLVDMAAQIAAGMAYLEMHNYIHCDLAARNVLVGKNNIVKVADFGLARLIANNEYSAPEGTKIPIKWTAPEAALYNRFSIKSDVWSFGILLTELVTYGRIPYPGMTNGEVLQRVESGYRMPCPPNTPKSLYQIMLDCWKNSAADRPTFEFLQCHLEDLCYMEWSHVTKVSFHANELSSQANELSQAKKLSQTNELSQANKLSRASNQFTEIGQFCTIVRNQLVIIYDKNYFKSKNVWTPKSKTTDLTMRIYLSSASYNLKHVMQINTILVFLH